MSNFDKTVLSFVLTYAPLASLPVVYVWFALVGGTWFSPLNFAFGLPLTIASFGAVLTATLNMLTHPLTVTNERLIVAATGAEIWLGLLLVQTYIRRTFQTGPQRLQWLFLVGWSNFLGLSTYFLLRRMLYTVGL